MGVIAHAPRIVVDQDSSAATGGRLWEIATRQGNMRSRSKLRAMLSHDSFLGVIENEYVALHVIVSELAWYILVVTEKSRSIRRSTKAKPTCAMQ